jgi:predicted O-methyltransferase YrrM
MKIRMIMLLFLVSLVVSVSESLLGVEVVDLTLCKTNVCDDLSKNPNFKIEMSEPEIRFLVVLIQKYKPKKILEIGVAEGGSSAVILNCIKNMPETKLYSIDLSKICYNNRLKLTGYVVTEHFPYLMGNKWKLYLGNISAKFIEEIGNDIDFVFIDTMHKNPGEILDFLQILPFLKEGAVVVFHDISNHLFVQKDSWTNCVLLSTIKGKKIIPKYDSWAGHLLTFPNIGAIELETNQQQFVFDYFNLLVLPWYYMPNDEELLLLKSFFKKYYDNFCSSIFERAICEHTRLLNKSIWQIIIEAFLYI